MIASAKCHHGQGAAFSRSQLAATSKRWQKCRIGGCHRRAHGGKLHVLLDHLVVLFVVFQQAASAALGRSCGGPLLPHFVCLFRWIHGVVVWGEGVRVLVLKIYGELINRPTDRTGSQQTQRCVCSTVLVFSHTSDAIYRCER